MRKQASSRLRKSFVRRVDTRDTKERFLIVCEGTKTEVNYFKRFRVPGRVARLIGTGRNTLSLVNQAIDLRDRHQFSDCAGGKYDQCWCVFDRDSFDADDFDNAIQKAESSDFRVAYSNEAFEQWYLLHFGFNNTCLSRSEYNGKLENSFGEPYSKSGDYYNILLPMQASAIENARKLLGSFAEDVSYSKRCPSTTVHLLVQELNKSVT